MAVPPTPTKCEERFIAAKFAAMVQRSSPRRQTFSSRKTIRAQETRRRENGMTVGVWGCETKGTIFRLLPGICDIVRVQKKLPGLSPALRNSEEAENSQEWLSHHRDLVPDWSHRWRGLSRLKWRPDTRGSSDQQCLGVLLGNHQKFEGCLTRAPGALLPASHGVRAYIQVGSEKSLAGLQRVADVPNLFR